ncbi:hypothetical protein AVEN_146084-1 [Araneus ventricosus]|uniref:Uncharacterized protein n=1 Tax=Araneus ventricosus TaxID=182803 RepID=A0A4Y2GQF5_ARAVE|nr:hypothetical protein AVEN_146084-1 [Araneus ventricosus]
MKESRQDTPSLISLKNLSTGSTTRVPKPDDVTDSMNGKIGIEFWIQSNEAFSYINFPFRSNTETLELAPQSPRIRTTSTEEGLTHGIRFSVHHAHIHDGSSVESGIEPGTLRTRGPGLTTRQPRSQGLKIARLNLLYDEAKCTTRPNGQYVIKSMVKTFAG